MVVGRKIIIMGAAGRDFHLFNCCYRDNPEFHVVAFTATQIPHIDDRRYPSSLAGSLYPDGIPIHAEEELDDLLSENDIDEVVFAYSDVHLDYVDERRRRVEAQNVAFSTFDVEASMLPSRKPVIAITAIRTGCGKSQVARRIVDILKELGKKTVAIRHPMPYGDLAKQAVQRFATYEDLERHECTIEEREEYEPHIDNGAIVYAGVDYAAILAQAEEEADVIVWDGGNNDTPFYKPDLWIVVADPHRAGHELEYFPGTVNFERADLILIGKIGYADAANIKAIEENAKKINPGARIVLKDNHAGEIVDPRPWAVGEIAATFEQYPNIGNLLPAMGYGDAQIRDLESTVNSVECDLVLVATPIDLTRLISIDKPYMRIGYSLPAEDGALTKAVSRAIG